MLDKIVLTSIVGGSILLFLCALWLNTPYWPF